MTDVEIQEMARRAAEWVASPEGQKTLEESLRRTEETIRRFEAASRIRWQDLHRPVRNWARC